MNMRLYNSTSCLFVPLEVPPTSIGRSVFSVCPDLFLTIHGGGGVGAWGWGVNFYSNINKKVSSVSCEATLQSRLHQVYYFLRVALKYMDV